MPRLLGIDIPDNKRTEIALRYVYGIGPARAKAIVEAMHLDPALRAKELTEEQLTQIAALISDHNYVIEGDLRREIAGNIKRLQAIQSYRGSRHRKGLPVRGQRTSTNARTRKGGRRTVGVAKKGK
jgi:small subunit ribosomal protein S13